jgi:hypothetical protein
MPKMYGGFHSIRDRDSNQKQKVMQTQECPMPEYKDESLHMRLLCKKTHSSMILSLAGEDQEKLGSDAGKFVFDRFETFQTLMSRDSFIPELVSGMTLEREKLIEELLEDMSNLLIEIDELLQDEKTKTEIAEIQDRIDDL